MKKLENEIKTCVLIACLTKLVTLWAIVQNITSTKEFSNFKLIRFFFRSEYSGIFNSNNYNIYYILDVIHIIFSAGAIQKKRHHLKKDQLVNYIPTKNRQKSIN